MEFGIHTFEIASMVILSLAMAFFLSYDDATGFHLDRYVVTFFAVSPVVVIVFLLCFVLTPMFFNFFAVMAGL